MHLFVQRSEPQAASGAQGAETPAAEVERAVGRERLPQRAFARGLEVLLDGDAEAGAAQ